MSESAEGSITRDGVTGDVTSRMTRRTFLKGTAMAAATAGAATVLSGGSLAHAGERTGSPTGGAPGLNILVIIVDEMRAPSVYLPQPVREAYLPNLTKLAHEGVDFTSHYIASTACVASRSAMVTGLYTHQTAMFGGTIGPDLNTGFPTYGTMLRDVGYETFWFGKWHLCFDKDRCPRDPYESYGFTAQPERGTCPDPWGGQYEGRDTDPAIRQQFVDWLAGRPANAPPWCATVSLVNPHDAALYPRGTTELEAVAPHVFHSLPANFETEDDRTGERKPASQQQLAEIVNLVFGELPDSGMPAELWIRQLDTYVLAQQLVDTEIGHVLRALEQSPFAQDTVVIFTSDHGDYTGSHGLRGKGYAMYEESILVPFTVKDPTGTWITGQHVPRRQLSSHVDLAPLLLTLATGNERWREEPQYEHLTRRLSLAKILANPRAAGRPYAVFATDEPSLAKSLTDFFGLGGVVFPPVPDHIMGVCMERGKYAQYAYWQPGTTDPESQGMEFEGYDDRTRSGQLELHNSYGSDLPGDQELIEEGQRTLDHAIENELDVPLPAYLLRAQEEALKNWFKVYKETGRP